MLTSMGMSPGRLSEGQGAASAGAPAEGPSGTVTPAEGTTPTGGLAAQQQQASGRPGSLTWSPSSTPAVTPAGGSGGISGPGEGPMAAGTVQVGFELGVAGVGDRAAVPPLLGLPSSPTPSPGTHSAAAPGTLPPRTPPGAAGPSSARGPPASSLLLSPHSPAGSQLAAELAALEAEEEEEGEEARCMVCREGYRLRPRELLCAYVYCKALHIPTVSTSSTSASISSSSSSASAAAAALEAALSTPGGHPALFMPPGSPCGAVYSTVTHFNLIHASCHAAARAADASLRAPKREWDGATLRNGDVSGAK